MILPYKILHKAEDQIKKATLGLPNAFPWGKKKSLSLLNTLLNVLASKSQFQP